MWSPSFRRSSGVPWRQWRKRLDRWESRAWRALREPLEAALAVALLGALVLPLLVEQRSDRAPSPRPGQAPRRHQDAGEPGAARRPATDMGEDEDDLEGAIASW